MSIKSLILVFAAATLGLDLVIINEHNKAPAQPASRAAPEVVIEITNLAGAADFDHDPSEDPAVIADPDGDNAVNTYDGSSRYRIAFNLQGHPGVMISNPRGEFGNTGGNFQIYLKGADNKFHVAGALLAHPEAITIAERPDGDHITAYIRTSAHAGTIEKSLLTADGVHKISAQTISADDFETALTDPVPVIEISSFKADASVPGGKAVVWTPYTP